MSECMGLVRGTYDAKKEGFKPGGVSVHNAYTPHGPDAETFEQATNAELKPAHTGDGLAFMLESRLPFAASDWSMAAPELDSNYIDCWKGLPVSWNGQ